MNGRKKTMEREVISALSGDRKLQEELTENGCLLPCPCCGGVGTLSFGSGPYYVFNVRARCKNCGLQTAPALYGNNGTIKLEEANEFGKEEALRQVIKRWNTRLGVLNAGNSKS